ncbi:MAG: aldehyde dehydrogenase family protein [Parvularculaceae bacterium]
MDLTRADAIPDEEHFGPMLQIYRVKTFDAAIERANATVRPPRRGFSDDAKKWDQLLSRSRAPASSTGNPPDDRRFIRSAFGGVTTRHHARARSTRRIIALILLRRWKAQALLAMPKGQVGIKAAGRRNQRSPAGIHLQSGSGSAFAG